MSVLPRPLLRTPLLSAALALLAPVLPACAPGTSAFDACNVTADRAPAAAAVDATASDLTCDTTAGTPCTGDITVTNQACTGGFALVVTRGGVEVGLRFRSDGSAWTFGAALGSGTTLGGSVTIQGMVPPGEPVPPAGKVQKVNFALSAADATYTGTAVTTW